MIISMHIGAHATNGAGLMRTLAKNAKTLADHGVAVPAPARYREILPGAMKKVRDNKANVETQEMLIDELTEAEGMHRIVMSFEDLICLPALTFDDQTLYKKADFKLPWLRNVFGDCRMEFFFGIRNPATFVTETFAMCGDHMTYDKFLGDMPLSQIRWAPLLDRMKMSCPDASFNVYSYEDTPVTWPQVLHEVAGVDSRVPLEGELDMIAEVMQREGMKRLRTYLHTHKPQTEAQRQRILNAFLDKYVDESKLAAEIETPGWTVNTVDALTEMYETDLEELEQMHGVNLISL